MLFLYQEEAVKKARARSVGTNFRLSSQARHQRAVREFRQKIRREEEEARLASKVGPNFELQLEYLVYKTR